MASPRLAPVALALLGLALPSAADNWTTTTSGSVHTTGTTKVGVGVSAPQAALTVRRQEGLNGEKNLMVLERDGTKTTSDAWLAFGYRADATRPTRVWLGSGVNLPLDFRTSGRNQAMTLLNNGNLGINNTNPQTLLHLSAATPELTLTSTAASPWAAIRGNATTWLLGYAGAAGSEEISIGSQDNVSTNRRFVTLSSGGKLRMKIDADGRVGIGTSSPAYRLDVFGGDGVFGGSTSTSARAEIGGGAYAHAGAITNHDFRLRTNNVDRMAIDREGRVGIGVMAPAHKLEVSGDVKVSGFIDVASVRTRSWNITTPDYVFEPGYALPPLRQVESFVSRHRHLPEIPSASELEREGMDLAEMNLRLLKKVEELTLYAIAQDKRNRALEKRLEAVEKRGSP